MMTEPDPSNSSWTMLRGRANVQWLDRLVQTGMGLVASSATIFVFLIFVFVVKEAMPVFLGTVDPKRLEEAYQPDQIDMMTPAEIQTYLDLSPEQYGRMDRETLRLMMQVKWTAFQEQSEHPHAKLNTASWRYLLLPFQWEGYEAPVHIWQPISTVAKYNIIPLLIGSIKTTLVAMLFAVPCALSAAVFVSQLCSARLREWIKPAIEFLAGIPSVVLGFFALMVLASILEDWIGYETRLNAFVAGIALGLAVIPLIFSIAEDALSSVPRHYSESALALGASPWHAAWKIAIPAALPGILAATVLGFGRAIGETMIVLMASGNASIVSLSLTDSARTVTATIAAELAETVFGDPHYRILFMLGSLLFGITFLSNWISGVIIRRFKDRLEVIA